METVYDTLSDINKDINAIKKPENWNNNFLKILLKHAFLPEHKFLLPVGEPPYKVNEMNPIQTKGIFWQEIKKFGTYTRSEVKTIQRERIFIQALEALDGQSQQILLAVKEQNLYKLFPNLTRENLTNVGCF
jgi:hypothetical protein